MTTGLMTLGPTKVLARPDEKRVPAAEAAAATGEQPIPTSHGGWSWSYDGSADLDSDTRLVRKSVDLDLYERLR